MKLYVIYCPIEDCITNGGKRGNAGYGSRKKAEVYLRYLKQNRQKYNPNIEHYRIVEVNIV